VRGLIAAAAIVVMVSACTTTPVSTTGGEATSSLPSTTSTTAAPFLTGPGVVESSIHVGVFLPLTGSLSSIGTSVLNGQLAYWDPVNEDLGGVAGQFTVVVDQYDTAYDEDTATGLLAAHRNDLAAISSSLGTPVTAALLNEAGGLPVMVGSETSTWAANESAVFDLAVPTYRAQVEALWVRLDGSTIGFIAPDGAYGDDCLDGAGSSPDVVVRYPQGTTDFETQVTQLLDVNDVIACVTNTDLARIVATWELLGTPPPMFVTAPSFGPSLFTALESVPSELFVAGAPPPYDSQEPGMALFRASLADTPADLWTFFGYTQAATMHLLLEQAVEDRNLTWEGILAAREEIGHVDLGFGWGAAWFDRNLPVVPVIIQAPDIDAVFGLRPVD